jgi:hypothetical protein
MHKIVCTESALQIRILLEIRNHGNGLELPLFRIPDSDSNITKYKYFRWQGGLELPLFRIPDSDSNITKYKYFRWQGGNLLVALVTSLEKTNSKEYIWAFAMYPVHNSRSIAAIRAQANDMPFVSPATRQSICVR